MDKPFLIDGLRRHLQAELTTLLQASDQAHQSATHSESKAENKYDTRGLEAAYLAHGLSVRVAQLHEAVAAVAQWTPPAFGDGDRVALGALVTLEDEQGNTRRILLAEHGGGARLESPAGMVAVVTLAAPLGRALKGRELDDEIQLEIAGKPVRYTLVALA
ncbi:transcription elongation factor GreAB [Motiliproteus sediminis]|uniref:transcription elongation factor GreAB n=1 Tax=Motiliproteus sediminis TaxID=1468178 RepID=UPI001AEF5E4E|nr:transcription elongation factor GreAB [Motiliproteus sediminis]